MAKKKNKQKQKARLRKQERREKRQQRLYERATRDMDLALQRLINELYNQQFQAQQDYLGAMSGYESAFGGYQNLLKQIPEFSTAAQQQQFLQNLQSLSGMLSATPPGVDVEQMYGIPVGAPANEAQAAKELFATLGANTLGMLGSMEAMQDAYRQNALIEAGMARRSAMGNAVQSMQDVIEQLRQRMLNVNEMAPEMFLQRLDELRQQALENKLAQQKIRSDQAFAEWLMNSAQSALSGGGRGGGGRGGGGGGEGGGGGGDVGTYGNYPGGAGTPTGAPPGATQGGGAYPTGSLITRKDVNRVRRKMNVSYYTELPPWLRRTVEAFIDFAKQHPGKDTMEQFLGSQYSQFLNPKHRILLRHPRVRKKFMRQFGSLFKDTPWSNVPPFPSHPPYPVMK
jgi:hypothetical protein